MDEALRLDEQWRTVLAEVEGLRSERNTISKEIGEMSKQMKTAETKEAMHAEHRRSDLMARSSFIGEKLEALEAQVKQLDADLRSVLYEIPNIPADDVPDGPDESANVVVRQSGEPPKLEFEPTAALGAGRVTWHHRLRTGNETGRLAVLRAPRRGRAAATSAHPVHAGLPREPRL